MATKVNVKNFQSIKNATIEIDGFTVITGKNNSGKTALQRAIKGVFENARGHSFVRHGEDNCEVSVSFADGDKVTWHKGKKENRYVINGKTYDKVGAGVPDELVELGVFPLQCGGKTISPQFAPQFTGQVFLLNETGSVMAEAVSDVERVSTLNKALKESERDKRSCSSELKVRKSDKKKLEKDIEIYDGLEDLQEEIDKMDRQQKALNDLQDEISNLKSLLKKYQESISIVEELNGVTELEIPKENLKAIQDTISDLKQKQVKYKRATRGVELIDAILSHIEEERGVLENNTLITSVKRCESGIRMLKGFQDNIEEAQRKVDRARGDIENAEQELVTLNEELHKELKEHNNCPLCGGDVCG